MLIRVKGKDPPVRTPSEGPLPHCVRTVPMPMTTAPLHHRFQQHRCTRERFGGQGVRGERAGPASTLPPPKRSEPPAATMILCQSGVYTSQTTKHTLRAVYMEVPACFLSSLWSDHRRNCGPQRHKACAREERTVPRIVRNPPPKKQACHVF